MLFGLHFKKLSSFVLALLIFLSVSALSHAADSPYTLEIIQPRAGLNIENRFYKAYPNLPYEVRAAVIGGSYPYTFALTTAPAGMTVNINTGLINWPSPPVSATAYPVTLTVTDQANVSKQVSWTIKVTTDKFMFVDQVNGHYGATGTIDDPVKGVIDVYGGTTVNAKRSDINKGYFVYFKNGRYSLDGFIGDAPTLGLQMTNKQPLVWMAYPGAAPVIEMSKVAFRLVDTDGDNLYIEGFDIDTIDTNADTEHRMGFRIGSLSNNVTFRKNKFHHITPTDGSLNQSAIMISHDAAGKFWSFQDNEFYDLGNAYGILGYNAQKVLIEDNYFHEATGDGGGHSIGPKTSTNHWFIRHNTITNAKDFGIWLFGNDANYGDMEVSYNNVSMQSGGVAFDINQAENWPIGSAYVFRNTFKGSITIKSTPATVGPFTFKKNVIINSEANGYACANTNLSTNPCILSKIIMSDNLIGTASAGIIDSSGRLTSAYKGYLGNAGWEIPLSSGEIDTTPDPFSFTAKTGVAFSSVVTSSSITVAGINAAPPITVAGGKYSINGAAYTANAGTVNSGDSVTLQLTASANASTKTSATVTIGGVAGTFDVTTLAADTTPNAFSFTAKTGVALSSVVTSSSITVAGITVATPITVAGGKYSINGAAYTASAGTVNAGNTVSVQLTASATASTKTSATVTIGGVAGTFDVTTLADTTPNAFSFTAKTGVALSSLVTSSSMTVTGITGPTPITVTGGKYSINGAAYTASAGTVSLGGSVTLQLTSSATSSTKTSATVTIGGVAGTFDVTTVAADTTPNAFSFTAQTNVVRSTAIVSNAVTIGGITVPTAISVSGGSYSVNGTAYTTAAGTVSNGDTVKLKLTSSSTYASLVKATLTVGGVAGVFNVTTGPLPASVTSLTASTTRVGLGKIVTFTASVSGAAPTGTVNFKDGNASIAACSAVQLVAGVATCSTSALSAGEHAISASYTGDANNAGSTSAILNEAVLLKMPPMIPTLQLLLN